MSSHTNISVTCPHCRETTDTSIWSSINTMLDPEMKAAVRDRSAFLFTCPHCGTKTYLNYGFLYHQMEDKIMIHYADSDEDAEKIDAILTGKDDPKGMMAYFRKDNYLIRVVRSQNELLDKLAIFDAGLDDRIVEIFKLYVLAKLQEDPAREHSSIKLLFFANDGKYFIQVLTDGKTDGVYEMPGDLYEELKDDYAPHLNDMRHDDFHIDRSWAMEALRRVNNNA